MTHLQLCSSVPASLLLFHSASPRATRRGTHWTEMIPNLSRSRTAEKMREKWNYVTRSHSSFGFSDILTLIIWQKSSVNRDCVELQSGCCDTPPPNFTQSCSLPFKTNTHCPSGPPSTTELTDSHLDDVCKHIHTWVFVCIPISDTLFTHVLYSKYFSLQPKGLFLWEHVCTSMHAPTSWSYSVNTQVSWMTATATRAAMLAISRSSTPAMRHL